MYIINEIFKGHTTEILNVLSLISIVFGVLVIVIKNPITSVLFLIGLFLSVAVYLVLLGINYIGLSYLLVYVGAVSILFIFILMLINVRVSELSSETNNSIPLAVIVIVLFNYYMYKVLPANLMNYKLSVINEGVWSMDEDKKINYNEDIITYNEYEANDANRYININYNEYKANDLTYHVTTDSWDNKLVEMDDISSIGNIFYTTYSIWLILTCIILLLAMVGAIVITIRQKT